MPTRRPFATLLTVALLIASTSVVLPGAVTRITTPTVRAPALDAEHALLTRILQDVVVGDDVAYGRLADAHLPALRQYQVQLANAPVPTERSARMAHYINAYNALTLVLVLEHLPEREGRSAMAAWGDFSVMQVDEFWRHYTFEVGGEWLTLDAIEHQRIRPLGEPRIHFAVNCASESCPPLLDTAFTAGNLERQLAAAASRFVASAEQVRLVNGGVVTNPILSWFADDFGGEAGVRRFVLAHATDAAIRRALRNGTPITYFDYDWSLNLVAGH